MVLQWMADGERERIIRASRAERDAMTGPEITIRDAHAADVGRLALIGATTFLETYAETVDGDDLVTHCATLHSAVKYAELLAGPDARAWLAEVQPGRAPVGYLVMTRPELTAAVPGDLEVRRIYVLQRYQGRRIGVRLLNEAIAAARAAGAHRLLLGVYSANDAAIAFYTRSGFRRIGTREFTVGASTYHDYVLALALD
jgi:ribosomal protein S18 acetylase RimI-like enzyme